MRAQLFCALLSASFGAACGSPYEYNGGDDGGGGGGDDGGGGSGSGSADDCDGCYLSDVHVQPDGAAAWLLHGGKDAANLYLARVDLSSGALAEVLDAHGTTNKHLFVAGAHRVVAVLVDGGRDELVTIDTDALAPIARSTYVGDLEDGAVSPSGKLVWLREASDNRVHLFDVETLADVVLAGSFAQLAWAPNDQLLATSVDTTGHLLRYDLHAGAADVTPTELARGVSLYELALSPDGARAAVKPTPDAVAVVDLATGQTATTPTTLDIARFFDGNRLVVNDLWSGEAKVEVLDLTTHAIDATLALPAGTFTLGYTVFDDPATLIVSPAGYASTIWDANSGEAHSEILLDYVHRSWHQPGEHALWCEGGDLLWHINLVTGGLTGGSAQNVDSTDRIPGTDDVLVGGTDHDVWRFSLRDGVQSLGWRTHLADPATTTAPYAL